MHVSPVINVALRSDEKEVEEITELASKQSVDQEEDWETETDNTDGFVERTIIGKVLSKKDCNEKFTCIELLWNFTSLSNF